MESEPSAHGVDRVVAHDGDEQLARATISIAAAGSCWSPRQRRPPTIVTDTVNPAYMRAAATTERARRSIRTGHGWMSWGIPRRAPCTECSAMARYR